ncbi:MAG: endopeptidase La [Bradymonadales bacterium]|jgi:ATP-dependent Lon protease
MQLTQEQNKTALVALRGEVLFPHNTKGYKFGRPRSIYALRHAFNNNAGILLLGFQRDNDADPVVSHIYRYGVLAKIVSDYNTRAARAQVRLKAIKRVELINIRDDSKSFWANYLDMPDEIDNEEDESRTSYEELGKVLKELALLAPEFRMSSAVRRITQAKKEEQFIALASMELPFLEFSQRYEIFEETGKHMRLDLLNRYISLAYDSAKKRKEQKNSSPSITLETQEPAAKGRRLQPSNQNETTFEPKSEENALLLKRIEDCLCNDELKERLRSELAKLESMQPMSSEATVIRNYLDWVLDMPWGIYTDDNHDINAAEKILEKEHHGLEKPKERIVEFLAVQSLVKKLKGPILCFVGPPGIGKTSLASSVANAMNRNFIRMSLGGVRDEAEIRGHRRTYVGAMPGKIMQMLRRVKSANPVFLLDEIDKISSDYRGDPASALLEVLDPEQNAKFNDHYIDADFDLSDVIFIATANNLDRIPLPLRDRMEIIELESYTEDDKLEIAKAYLVPKQMQLNGIDSFNISFRDDALRTIINSYTLEAGVRSLEREISAICRKLACDLLKAKDEEKKCVVTPELVKEYLGRPKIRERKIDKYDEIGITTGLAVTMAGGTTLKSEVAVVKGSGKLIITGQLKDLMQESAHAAMSYVRSRAESFGLDPDFSSKVDIHIHFPGDHAPKDGPSAGITMATSIISALCKIPVKRDIAMTGEITLRGRVLTIGGLRDKLLAAKRHGIKTVVIPADNMEDYKDIPQKLVKGLKIKAVKNMDQVVLLALKLSAAQKKQFKEALGEL